MIPISLVMFHHFTGSLGTGATSFAAVISEVNVETKGILKHTSAREPVVWSCTRKSQVRIGSGVPAPGGETGCTLWVVEQHEVIIYCGCIGSTAHAGN